MSTKPPPTPKPRRRWLQFRLRTMMIVMRLGVVPKPWKGRHQPMHRLYRPFRASSPQ